jgi:spoIIIJ-associated protein
VSNHVDEAVERNSETEDVAATVDSSAVELDTESADFTAEADVTEEDVTEEDVTEEDGAASTLPTGQAADNAPDPTIAAPDDDAADDFEEDGRADDALDFIVDVLGKMAMDCTVDLMENGPGEPASDVRIEISGEDSNRIIGRKGQTLGALQFLTNRVVNRPPLTRRHVLIDADGYRFRREGALSQMAKKLGKQAATEHKVITFEPMSAQDRRIVHLALAKFPGVVTKSEGRGASRRVQILPTDED